jgi:hypothetical protein
MRLALAFVSLALAACGSHATESGIRGQAFVGTCAVEVQGMDCSGPVQTTFEVRQGGRVVNTVGTDAGGFFSVRVEPGSYVLAREDGLPSLKPVAVVVRPGAFTTVQLGFDSGIR